MEESKSPRVVWVGLVDSVKGSLMFSRTWEMPTSKSGSTTRGMQAEAEPKRPAAQTALHGTSLAVALLEKSRVAWAQAREETQICAFRNDREIIMLVRSVSDVIYIVAGVGDAVELELEDLQLQIIEACGALVDANRATPDAIRSISSSIAILVHDRVPL